MTISSLFPDAEVEDAPRSRVALAVLSFVAVVATLSVVLSTLTVAPALVVGEVVGRTNEAWQGLPVDLPDEDPVPLYTTLLDKDGKKFAEFYSENRVPVTYEEIGDNVINALIATEDARFFDHGGVDPRGVGRAVVANLGGKEQGASTITMQLVENIFISRATTDQEATQARERSSSLIGKIEEVKYATALEDKYTKEEILEMYLNTVYLGSGAYGIGTAAQRYFSTDSQDLSLGQAATIVGALKSPVIYDPIENPQGALDRRNTVLARMESSGMITKKEYEEESAKELGLKPRTFTRGCAVSNFPHYCEYVKAYLLSSPQFGATRQERDRNLYLGGLTITTALDRKATRQIEKIAKETLEPTNRVATGIATVEPGTGYVRALASNRDFGSGKGETEIVYATSRFQPGSTFKPIVLAAAVEAGFSPSRTLNAPQRLSVSGLDSPQGGFSNSPNMGYGRITAREAAKKSVNTWFVNLIAQVGVKESAAMAVRLGDTALEGVDLTGREASLALGAYEASPLDMASVYATFASGGISCEPTPIMSLKVTRTGETQEDFTSCQRALTPGVASTVTSILRSPFTKDGTAEGLSIGRPAIGKTGTTNGYAANWFVGATPNYSTAVWVGDPRGGTKYPLRGVRTRDGRYYDKVYGADIAGPLWNKSMTTLHRDTKKTSFPKAVGATLTIQDQGTPYVVGLNTLDAASTLLRLGHHVVLSKDLDPNRNLAPGVVARTKKQGDTIVLVLSHGTPKDLLGKQVRLNPTTGALEAVTRKEAP